MNVQKEQFTSKLWDFLWIYRANEMDVLQALILYKPWYQKKVQLEIAKRKGIKETVKKTVEEINFHADNETNNETNIGSYYKSADKTCPECGGKEFQPGGGCDICLLCGFSKCG